MSSVQRVHRRGDAWGRLLAGENAGLVRDAHEEPGLRSPSTLSGAPDFSADNMHYVNYNGLRLPPHRALGRLCPTAALPVAGVSRQHPVGRDDRPAVNVAAPVLSTASRLSREHLHRRGTPSVPRFMARTPMSPGQPALTQPHNKDVQQSRAAAAVTQPRQSASRRHTSAHFRTPDTTRSRSFAAPHSAPPAPKRRPQLTVPASLPDFRANAQQDQ